MGDEWQGLLTFHGDYRPLLDFFRERLPGLEFYTGIGVGGVTVHDFKLAVNQLDGPAFHKARTAIDTAKRGKFSLVYIH